MKKQRQIKAIFCFDKNSLNKLIKYSDLLTLIPIGKLKTKSTKDEEIKTYR